MFQNAERFCKHIRRAYLQHANTITQLAHSRKTAHALHMHRIKSLDTANTLHNNGTITAANIDRTANKRQYRGIRQCR